MMTPNTHPHIAKFISSVAMESSETQKRIIDLGKKLISEFQPDNSLDTLSRWMLHFIAQKIVRYEEADEQEKLPIEKDCFKTILDFWAHHSVYPSHTNPFRNFEPIFDALEALNPENHKPYFQTISRMQREKPEDVTLDGDGVKELVDLALNIDITARILIKTALSSAVTQALDENTKNWLETVLDLPDSEDASIIIRTAFDDSVDDKERTNTYKTEILKERLEKLKAFGELSHLLQTHIECEISSLISHE